MTSSVMWVILVTQENEEKNTTDENKKKEQSRKEARKKRAKAYNWFLGGTRRFTTMLAVVGLFTLMSSGIGSI